MFVPFVAAVIVLAAEPGGHVAPFGSASPGAGLHALSHSTIHSRGQARPASDAVCEPVTYDCAVLQVEHGEPGAGIATLQRLLAYAPHDLRVLNLLGIALSKAGRIDEANVHFREALELAPDFHPARRNLAVNEFNEGRLSSAEDLFKEVLAHAPGDEIAHLHMGEVHYVRKQFADAVPHYEKAGAALAANPAWMLRYAACLLEQGDAARAGAVLDRLPSGDAQSRFEAGVLLGRAGVHAEAARFFGTARSGYGDPYVAGYNQTLMLLEAGDYEAAIRVAEDLLGQGLMRGELYNLVSRAYVATQRVQEAYDALRTAARLERTEERHYLDLALICLDHENFDLGLEILDVGLQYLPRAASLYLYRGVLLVMQGLIEKAVPEFERARRLAPGGPVADVALAMAWMQSGNTPKAVDLLRVRARENPQDAIVPYMFGIALMRSGLDPADEGAAEAVQAFEDAIRLNPSLPGPRSELGKVLLRRGDTQRAIQELEHAVALDPENAAPAYALAQAYRRAGETVRAQELLAHVTRLNAQGRGDDPDGDLKRIVVRLVREGAR